ncbi:MAG: amidohydrolase [Elusimicrobiota bacterium]|jgi:amidohydrolase|nr:amidohydrolase [Elusimicrobiota bacterium]
MTFEDEVINIRRHIHKNPEPSFKEFKTAQFIEKKLKEFKIPSKRVAKTGVVAEIKSANSKKTVALRADTDALLICENNKLEYKSKNQGVMHACGHDCHTAIVLGAAKLLSGEKENLKGNVRFIFQPAEELSNGAKEMIKEGVLKDSIPEFILGVHTSPWIKSGKIAFKYGEMMAAVDKINITLCGKIAHGAYPHLGKDALIAAANFLNAAQTIVSRELDPTESAVVTFGKISGGQTYNTICDEIKLEGTVRTLNNNTRELIKKSILDKLKATESAFDVKCVCEYLNFGEPLINTNFVTDICRQYAEEFYGKQNVILLEKPSMGGEDFSDYLNIIAGNFMYIGSSKNKDTSYPWHHCNFNVDESVIPKASRYLAYFCKKFLN